MAQSNRGVQWIGLVLSIAAIGLAIYLILANGSLSRQIDELEQEIMALRAELQDQLSELGGQISALEGRVAEVESLTGPLGELREFIKEQFPEGSPWRKEGGDQIQ